jgi:hypothetical protein
MNTDFSNERRRSGLVTVPLARIGECRARPDAVHFSLALEQLELMVVRKSNYEMSFPPGGHLAGVVGVRGRRRTG